VKELNLSREGTIPLTLDNHNYEDNSITTILIDENSEIFEVTPVNKNVTIVPSLSTTLILEPTEGLKQRNRQRIKLKQEIKN